MEVVFVFFILFLGFYSQSVVGFSSGLIAAPLLILFLSFPEMVLLLALVGLFFSAYQVPRVLSSVNKRMLLYLSPSLLLGSFIGVRSLTIFSRNTLEIILLVVIGLGLLLIIFRSRIHLPKPAAVLVGFLGGFFSGSVSAGGSVYASYIDSQTSSSDMARSTLITVIALVGLFKLPMLVYSGFMSSSILITALLAIPVMWLAMYVGNKTAHLLSQKMYHIMVFLLVLFSAVLVVV